MAKGAAQKTGGRHGFLRMIPRHSAFAIALAAGAVALVVGLAINPSLAAGIAANAMFAVYLGIVFAEIPRLTPEFLKEHADQEDPPFWVIMLVVVGIVAVSVFSLFAALAGGSGSNGPHIVVGLTAVVLGWFVVHTMMALHYAYEFYESPQDGPEGKSGKRDKSKNVGGFGWPKGDPPDGVAFIYLSFQVGSAVQISDVPATSNKMRAIVVAHTTFSFFYNTTLLAAAVNVVISAAGGK